MDRNNNIGGPTKLSGIVIQKLTDYLKLGLTVQDACSEAGISTSTSYYNYKKEQD